MLGDQIFVLFCFVFFFFLVGYKGGPMAVGSRYMGLQGLLNGRINRTLASSEKGCDSKSTVEDCKYRCGTSRANPSERGINSKLAGQICPRPACQRRCSG